MQTSVIGRSNIIQVEAPAGDVIAGAGGAAGQAPGVGHQPSGDTRAILGKTIDL